jgi:RNA polymerase sigma factor (sigma-70 family)
MELVLGVNQAIDRLAQLDPRQAQIVTFRIFGGLTEEEIADVLNISSRTVKRDWRMAKAWLRGALKEQDGDHAGRTLE